MDYIEDNMDKDLSLDELAAESHFSKYHFSRIFDAMVGETSFKFIKRVRLEKAATRLRLYPDETITKIAFECGFNDLAVFSRNFSDFFFERYGENYDAQAGKGDIEIWIPVD